MVTRDFGPGEARQISRGEPGKRAVVDMVASKMKMRASNSLVPAEMQPGTASHLRDLRKGVQQSAYCVGFSGGGGSSKNLPWCVSGRCAMRPVSPPKLLPGLWGPWH